MKRMYMRWPLPLPGMPARMPMEFGVCGVSQMLTVAHSSGVCDAAAIPKEGPLVTA